MKNTVVAYNPDKWFAVPANNGGNGPQWQWGNQILIGYTSGEAKFDKSEKSHQTTNEQPFMSFAFLKIKL